MALHDRIFGVGMLAVVDVHIRAAHADALDAQQHFARSRGRDRDVLELDLALGGHDCLFHRVYLLVIRVYSKPVVGAGFFAAMGSLPLQLCAVEAGLR